MTDLPKYMKALVAYEPDDYRLEEDVPVPRAGIGEMIIKVESCGVCASDVKSRHGAESQWGTGSDDMWIDPPFIPGHEIVGRIVEIGESVKGSLEVGDRVVTEQIVPCWDCRFCKRG